MSELERTCPAPINHRALTEDGLRFNEALYGPAADGTLSRIDPGDRDADEFEYAGIADGGILYRGGWTLNGERIPAPLWP